MDLRNLVLCLGLVSCKDNLDENSYKGIPQDNYHVGQSEPEEAGKPFENKKSLNCKNDYSTDSYVLFDAIVTSANNDLLSVKNDKQTSQGFLYMRDTFGSSYKELLSDFVSFYDSIPADDQEDLVCWTRYLARSLDQEKCFDFDIVYEAYQQAERSIEENYSEEIIRQRVTTARSLSKLLGINTMNLEKSLLDIAYQDVLNDISNPDKVSFARYLAEGTGVDVSDYENLINP